MEMDDKIIYMIFFLKKEITFNYERILLLKKMDLIQSENSMLKNTHWTYVHLFIQFAPGSTNTQLLNL